MRILICTMALLLAFALSAPANDDNMVKNGDFEKGKMGWKTEPGVHVIDITDAGKANKVLEVELDKNSKKMASTRVNLKSKTKALTLTLRVKPSPGFKSATPDGTQLTIRFKRADGSHSFWEKKVTSKDEWQEIKWDYSDLKGSAALVFSIEFHPGEGVLWVDDVVAKEM